MVNHLLGKLKKFLGFKEGQQLIWWLIGWQRVWWFQVFIAIPGFLGTFYYAFGENIVSAITMTISMLLHELGHAFVFHQNKIKLVVLYLFPLGAVAAPANLDEDKRSDALPWYQMAWLTLAGLIVNVMLIALGRILQRVDNPNLLPWGNALVFMNSILIFLNILPFWKMDAAMFLRTIFASLSTENDKKIMEVIVAAALMVLVVVLADGFVLSWAGFLVTLIEHFGVVVFLLLLIAGVWHSQGLDKSLSTSPQRMTFRQAIGMTGIYIGIVLSTLVLVFGM